MVSKKELEGMSVKALQKLIADAQALIQEHRAEKIQNLKTKWQAEAEEEGLTVMEVLGIRTRKPKGDGTRAPAKAKYKLPNGDTWSGKGRIPLALREALKGAKGWNEQEATFEDKEAREKALSKFLIE